MTRGWVNQSLLGAAKWGGMFDVEHASMEPNDRGLLGVPAQIGSGQTGKRRKGENGHVEMVGFG